MEKQELQELEVHTEELLHKSGKKKHEMKKMLDKLQEELFYAITKTNVPDHVLRETAQAAKRLHKMYMSYVHMDNRLFRTKIEVLELAGKPVEIKSLF
jgi:NurA-like 5'-3' nuclease